MVHETHRRSQATQYWCVQKISDLILTHNRRPYVIDAIESVIGTDLHESDLFNTIVSTTSKILRRSILAKTELQQKRLGTFFDLKFGLRLCRNDPWPGNIARSGD